MGKSAQGLPPVEILALAKDDPKAFVQRLALAMALDRPKILRKPGETGFLERRK